MADDPVSIAESFAPEIRRRAEEIETARRMPDDLARRMAEAGLFRIVVPELYGGAQVHPRVFFETLEATSRADAAVGWCLMIGTTTSLLAAAIDPIWAHEIYGDHPDVITCGVTAPVGRAVRTDGGLEVSGEWPFGSGSQISDWICGGCFIYRDGKPIIGNHGPEVLLAFFPASEVTIHDTWHTSGLCGTGSHHIEVNDAFVPEGRWAALGGRALVDAPLYRFPTLGLLALGVSAVSIGIAQHAIEAFIELAGSKTPTGSQRTLSARSAAQKDLAIAKARVSSARAYTLEAIDAAWEQAHATGKLSIETKANLRLAATNNAWSAVDAVERLYHTAGGSSVYRESELQRCFRDVNVTTQHIMVAQPTYEVIGKVALGIDPKTLL
jgi:alkylation response protein AidB-like acyl-CoA dehydrogenase